jgi:hypothetical protein
MFVPVTISMNDGTAVYSRGFDMLSSEARDMSIPLSQVGQRLVEGVGRQFATEGAWSGNPWDALSDKYAKWKEQKVPGLPKLVGVRATGDRGTRPQTYERSGQMLRDLTALSAVTVGPRRMAYIPSSDIAGYHEFGTDRMPARPPVEVPLGELREYDRTFIRWMNGLIVQAGMA